MSDPASSDRAPVNRQLLVFGGLLLAIVGLLAIGYFLFLRPNYVVLAQDLRPEDASAVVAELDKRGVDYKLKDGGTTILVPGDQADATRLAISGSEAAARGQIGFELFNKSDMGLTNFAQKINYQRALQGELVRTITQMDGVESARVHLGLPERALFRGDRTAPSAAVTLTMRPGLTADPARVAGIQQLVAAAVPDLPEAKVVVLDGDGRVISAAAAAPQSADPVLDEQHAIQAYFTARARVALERRMPGQRFAVRILLFPIADGVEAVLPGAADWAPTGEGAARNYRMRVLLVTLAAMNGDDQAIAREVLAQALAIDPARGDTLSFEVGPIDTSAAPQMAPLGPAPTAVSTPVATAAPTASSAGASVWTWIGLGGLVLVAIAALALMLRRRAAPVLSSGEHEAFAAKLRRQLNLAEDAPHAAG